MPGTSTTRSGSSTSRTRRIFRLTPQTCKQYFKLIEKGERKLPDVLSNILIRRTRNHILRWYGYDSETQQPVDPSRIQ